MSEQPAYLDREALTSLVEASRAIISELELRDVLTRIAEKAAAVLSAEGASVLSLDAERKQLVFETATGPTAQQIIGERFDAKLGIAGEAVRTRSALRVDDVHRDAHFFAGIDAKTNQRTTGLLAAPLIHKDQVLGVVEVINPIGRPVFTDRDLELLQVFANLAAAAAWGARANQRIRQENDVLKRTAPPADMIGKSPAFFAAMQLCGKVAGANSTVLLLGETGTGKELAAREIHARSGRGGRPFVAVNCAALPETLLESELFGHEKGAFTGANAQRPGRFELADGGTLFLDEIGEMSASIQVKLLRVLQEREFVRVGGTRNIPCDVRVIAATNRDLKGEVVAGTFRADLFYRLSVFPIVMPPLRERIDDVPLLVELFKEQLAPSLGVRPPTIHADAMDRLKEYAWPGNIRELRNIVERCVLLAGPEIGVEHLPAEIGRESGGQGDAAPRAGASEMASGLSKLADQERNMIVQALTVERWNQSAAARRLGISRDLLRYRVRKFGLEKPVAG